MNRLQKAKKPLLTPEIRFWLKVKKLKKLNGCWIWKACRDKNGYGKMTVNTKDERAHRFSWKIHFGEIPEKYFVCHKCDNPSCVNPGHLFIGTARDNNRDMIIKKRNGDVRGEKYGASVLTREDVIEIRKWAASKIRHGIIAHNFGVKKTYISNIVQRKTWKDI